VLWIEPEDVPKMPFNPIKQKFVQDMQIIMPDPCETKGWGRRVEIRIDWVDFDMQCITVNDHLG
jgi:hypothetical protein